MCKLREVEFGDPCLHMTSLVRKYELKGVAFVRDCEKTVGFTFYSHRTGDLGLTMDDLVQAKKAYDFFKELFKESLACQPSMSKGLSDLNVEWSLKIENREVLLKKIEQCMGVEWRTAFNTVFSAHEKGKSS